MLKRILLGASLLGALAIATEAQATKHTALGGALTGAAGGALVAGPVGAVVGGWAAPSWVIGSATGAGGMSVVIATLADRFSPPQLGLNGRALSMPPMRRPLLGERESASSHGLR